MDTPDWEKIFQLIRDTIGSGYAASVNQVAEGTERPDPFRVLVSTVISLRTRDSVTLTASERLFAVADTPARMAAVPPEQIAQLIYPAGFYRSKGNTIAEISRIILEKYNGIVPSTREELVALPGVGRKTANLVLGLGFAIPAICVDIHVHRIPNRLGWVRTTTPEQTERALMEILPREYWIPINLWLVGFGQQVCTPQSPHCSRCPLLAQCGQNNVTRSR